MLAYVNDMVTALTGNPQIPLLLDEKNNSCIIPKVQIRGWIKPDYFLRIPNTSISGQGVSVILGCMARHSESRSGQQEPVTGRN